ncbi:WD40 repeat domain-containing protein [Lentzea sp. NPDC059081]|uniref:WD40 repeat domain-containing protein n=1 Tax=Lentzea sp. NPDC059081 TaxID=3346719 RepID=UPI0036D06B63
MTEHEYDAFLSHSGALEGTLAPALRRGVQRFAKPWYRLRATRVFVDTGSSASAEALARSRRLVLLASPEPSEQVTRALDWWLEHRSPQRILVVLTSGEYARSVPAAVRKALGEDPRWVDLRWLRSAALADESNPRFRESVAGIASVVRDVPRDELIGEHVRQHRRTVRLARGVAMALAALLVVGLVAAVVPGGGADARTATARGLASAAVANLRTDLGLAQALAAEAYRTEPNAQTRSALFASLTASPHLDRYVQVGGEVTALAASADGKVAVAGTSDGRVVRLDLSRSTRSEIGVGTQPVTSVSVSANGGMIAAFSVGWAVRWDGASTVRRFEVPADLTSGLAAVSPSGRFTAFHAMASDRFLSIVHDGQNDRRTQRDGTGFPLLVLRLPDDETLVELSDTEWVRRSLASQEAVSTARGEVLPATGSWFGASPNGAQFGWSTDGLTRLWHTTNPTFAYNSQDAELRLGRPTPSHVAITDDGARTAVADTGTIYVYDMTASGFGSGSGEVARLEGNSETPFVEFLGSSDRLVSASHDRLVLWDLRKNTRLSSALPTRTPLSCNACPAPWLAVSHGKAAVTAGPDLSLGTSSESVGPDSDFGPVAWNSAGDKLYLVTLPEGIGETWQTQPVLRRLSRWKGDVTADHLVALRAAPDDSRLVTINEQGDVQVFAGQDFALERTIPLTRRLDQAGWPPSAALAAISPDTSIAAIVTSSAVELVDTRTGTRRTLTGQADAVTFTDNALLIQRPGTVEIWDHAGTTHRSIQVEGSALPGLTATADLAVHLRRDQSMVLTDLTTGDLLGQVPLAPPGGRFGRIGTAFDGPHRLITAVSDTPLTAWDLSADNWVRTACTAAARPLTADEWHRYVGTEPPAHFTC